MKSTTRCAPTISFSSCSASVSLAFAENLTSTMEVEGEGSTTVGGGEGSFFGVSAFTSSTSPLSVASSSPFAYMSAIVSSPPTRTPLTYSCGMTLHCEYSRIPRRSPGLASASDTSTHSYSNPVRSSTRTIQSEPPQAGFWRDPRMNRTIGYLLIRRRISSSTISAKASSGSFTLGLDDVLCSVFCISSNSVIFSFSASHICLFCPSFSFVRQTPPADVFPTGTFPP
mmetsp:Transcript_29245/g.73449  ORF Transcript_29245/g.73449 Transcript_29245/m.73449 type:complete len:227 (+) Transcript_29245:342-1022(+)